MPEFSAGSVLYSFFFPKDTAFDICTEIHYNVYSNTYQEDFLC